MGSSITKENREVYAGYLKDMKADTVFLAIDRYTLFDPDRNAYFSHISEQLEFFRRSGFETGLWLQAFGFGDPVRKEFREKAKQYTRLRSVKGREIEGDAMCPECGRFMEDYLDWIKDCAGLQPDLLMLDDDMCLSVRPGLGCFCDTHISLLTEKIGEKIPFADLPEKLFSGKGNRYRKAYLDVMGDTLRRFCLRVRKVIDAVDPSIRAGFAAGYTSWDIEGADAEELTRILAGKNRPFLRCTSAPYWVTQTMPRFRGHRLNSVIESARMQDEWMKNTDIEVFTENDSYPRPRSVVPASLIECFGAALRASGAKGELKYVFDYYAEPDEETGYIDRHVRNQPLYEFLENHFWNKEDDGVWVVEKRRKFEDMELDAPFAGEYKAMLSFFSPCAALLTANSLPTRYSPSGACAIAFGDNVRFLEVLPKKLILDAKGAMHLKELGVDTGFLAAEKVKTPLYEYFGDRKTRLLYAPEGDFYSFTLKDGAEIISTFENEEGVFPSAYRFQTENTEFLVYAFDAYSISFSSSVFVSSGRQKQLSKFTEPSFMVKGNPWLYELCRKTDSEAAVLLINLSEDTLINVSLELDKEYTSAEVFGADGALMNGKYVFYGDIPPFTVIPMVFR